MKQIPIAVRKIIAGMDEVRVPIYSLIIYHLFMKIKEMNEKSMEAFVNDCQDILVKDYDDWMEEASEEVDLLSAMPELLTEPYNKSKYKKEYRQFLEAIAIGNMVTGLVNKGEPRETLRLLTKGSILGELFEKAFPKWDEKMSDDRLYELMDESILVAEIMDEASLDADDVEEEDFLVQEKTDEEFLSEMRELIKKLDETDRALPDNAQENEELSRFRRMLNQVSESAEEDDETKDGILTDTTDFPFH